MVTALVTSVFERQSIRNSERVLVVKAATSGTIIKQPHGVAPTMLITVPIYVESRHGGEGEPTLFRVRPLFAKFPHRADADLERSLQKLTQDLRELLVAVARELRHESLASWAWNPTVAEHRLNLDIQLRSRVARGRFLFVTFESLGRKLAFCPRLDSVWFEIGRGQSLEHRAQHVLTDFFREQQREAHDEELVRPEDYALHGTAWVTTLEVEIKPEQSVVSSEKMSKALLGGENVSDGATELTRCGRCLNWLSQRELSQAVGREREVGELERRLSSSDRRPVLILGERLAGKTAIVHDYVARVTARRDNAAAPRGNVWSLSPQRLISGMSFVGQWESRLLAILNYARKKHLVLYFDDFPGLYLAGQSRASSLNMATVLKPFLERRECRFLAEMTPETWRILRERDRGLADLFDILPIHPTTRDETAKIVMGVRRQLESEYRCRFQIDALTTVLDLQERFATETAFPGKAVSRLRELAVQNAKGNIGRDRVLDAFQASSGLTSRFFDPRQSVTREEIVSSLTAEVVGQDAAVASVADVLTAAKTQLSDPRRPLGSLLFVGPTGVGKTQLAKATARFLFGNADRLIRFDLNQFVQAGAAARLVGTFEDPDGLLTGAVRRSSFAVLLFDEIEKAHPEVFDLLLQVLGEGRLTDALGRTVSFTNTVIVMTSNLGVRDAEQQLGFANDALVGDHVWIKTIERFFRPEFFNRIDRIVPFQRLSREIVRDVALLALGDVLNRDGCSRRQSFVVVEPRAMDQLVQEGYSPVWGARGLKRTLERQLVQPLARSLAGMSPQAVTRLHVYPATDGVAVQVDELHEATAPAGSLCEGSRRHGRELVERTRDWLAEMKVQLESHRPEGPISTKELSASQYAYFSLQERQRQVEECCSALLNSLQQLDRSPAMPSTSNFKVGKLIPRSMHHDRAEMAQWRDAAAREQFHSMLDAMVTDAPSMEASEILERDLLHMAALAHADWRSLENPDSERMVVFFLPQLRAARSDDEQFPKRYLDAWGATNSNDGRDWGLDVIWHGRTLSDGPYAIELRGALAVEFSEGETGIHLELLGERSLRSWSVMAMRLGHDQTIPDAWLSRVAHRERWLDRLMIDTSLAECDPWKMTNILRLFEANGTVLDFRTSQIHAGDNISAFLRQVMLDMLPLPLQLSTD